MLKLVLWGVVGVIALILLGSLVVSLIGVLFKVALYLLVGLAVVGGAMYVVGKLRRGLPGSGRRSLGR